MLRRNQKPCPKCGNAMHRQSSCCKKCYVTEAGRPDSYHTRVCPVCSQEFRVHQAQFKRNQGHYCSRVCARKGSPTRKRTGQSERCIVCDKAVYRRPADLRKKQTDKHFCSTECWYQHNQGENNCGWNGGQNERINPSARVWRQVVLNRDGRKCRLCGSAKKIEVHHIKRFGTAPELRWVTGNGIALCHKCHVKFRNREEEFETMFQFMAQAPVTVKRGQMKLAL